MSDAAEELEVVEEVVESEPDIWPTDWRQQIAGDDEKALNQLGRYATPADVWTKVKAMESKISSGEWKENTPFPEKGSEDEIAQWRQDRGIPDTPDKYELTREMKDDEKAQLQGFFEYAHSKNFTPNQVNDMVDFFYQKLDEDNQLSSEGDKADLEVAEDKLRAEWGDEYRAHMNRIEALIDTVPNVEIDGEKHPIDLLDARLPNGSKVKANPEVMQFLLRAALAVNPATTVVPAGGDVASSIVDEIEQIREVMQKDRRKYNNDPKMQQRYGELLGALERTNPEEFAKIQR